MRVTKIIDKVHTRQGLRREVSFFAIDSRECGSGKTAAIAALQVRQGRAQTARARKRYSS